MLWAHLRAAECADCGRRDACINCKDAASVRESPPCAEGACGVLGCTTHDPRLEAAPPSAEQRPDPFSLVSVFKALPSAASRLARHVRSAEDATLPLPDEVWEIVMGLAEPAAAAALGGVCRCLRALARGVVPGLLLSLHPHQKMAVRWMLERESTQCAVGHPTLRALRTAEEAALPLYACTVTGALSVEPPPDVHDVRGGLFCDEPGLGEPPASSLPRPSLGSMGWGVERGAREATTALPSPPVLDGGLGEGSASPPPPPPPCTLD